LEALVSGGACWIALDAVYILPAACIGVAGRNPGESAAGSLSESGPTARPSGNSAQKRKKKKKCAKLNSIGFNGCLGNFLPLKCPKSIFWYP
jgi:hypothetical protein